MGAANLANFLGALKLMRYYDARVMQITEAIVLSRRLKFTSQAICIILRVLLDFDYFQSNVFTQRQSQQYSFQSYEFIDNISNPVNKVTVKNFIDSNINEIGELQQVGQDRKAENNSENSNDGDDDQYQQQYSLQQSQQINQKVSKNIYDHNQRMQKILWVLVSSFVQNTRRNQHDFSKFLLAISQMNFPAENIFKVIVAMQRDYQHCSRRYRDINFYQIRRAQLEYISRGQNLRINQPLTQKCIEKNKQYIKSNASKNDYFFNQVFQFIKNQFPKVRKNVVVQSQEIPVQMELVQGQNQIAIEACDQSCYAINEHEFLLGSVQANFELLERIGWKVVQVSCFDWERQEYREEIIQKIRQACNTSEKLH
eukprot:TRINITY_DN10831_c0_g1_i3.p1 TRINITY_DN10831_c0_g1~~TRINITY_DN10831_c0_g1_i3.p1  ORF type:complete len:394 (-),score=29.03 TRINITY_DN10831_c0_g1_i3:23-1129(-)